MAGIKNLLVQFSEIFPLNGIEVPDSAHNAELLSDLINTKLAEKGYTLEGREITGVTIVAAGPIRFFHSLVKDQHDADPNSVAPVNESGAIAASTQFNGYNCINWWKTSYLYTGSGDTGYGAGGLTTITAYLQLTGGPTE